MNDSIALGRDLRVMSLVGLGHGFSHFYQLALAPLFPLINKDLGFTFTELGVLMMAMYLASALLQPPAGFLVDRFGARPLLFGGLALMSISTLLYGFVDDYALMFVLAILVGVGNSVFHPCGYSIMTTTVSEPRIGRAYSAHIFLGYVGYALAPVAMAGAGALWGWRAAIIGGGIAGFVGLMIIIAFSSGFRDSRDEEGGGQRGFSMRGAWETLMRAPMLLCWLFFVIVAMAQIGIQTKATSLLTLMPDWGVDLETAGMIVTVFLFGVPTGVILGGFLADRTDHHESVVAVGYSSGAALMLVIWAVDLPLPGIVAAFLACGLLFGTAYPSRDLIVRRSTPKGASGKVFGFVYSGMDFGSLVTPVLFGWFIDTGIPREAFLCVALLWFASIFVLIATRASAERGEQALANAPR